MIKKIEIAKRDKLVMAALTDVRNTLKQLIKLVDILITPTFFIKEQK